MSEQQVTEVRTTQPDAEQEHRHFTVRAMQVIWLGLGVLEALIGLRIVFKLIAFDPGNILGATLYKITSPLLLPFAGLISTPVLGGTVPEIPAIFAMVIYALAAGVTAKLIEVIFYRPLMWWRLPKARA